jgi:mandelate racemase
MQAAALASVHAMPVSSHLFVEASAHAMSVTPTAHLIEYLDIAGAICAEPLAPKDGAVEARGPGLGLAWDPTAAERYRA